MSEQSAHSGEALFIALQAFEELKLPSLQARVKNREKDSALQRLSFNDIVACAKYPYLSESTQTLQTINQVLDYRRKYRFVLQQLGLVESPKQNAASTQEQVLHREEAQFIISLDIMGDGNALVKLQLREDSQLKQDKAGAKRAFIHCELSSSIEVFHLQRDESGNFLMLMADDDSRVGALSDLNSHLYLSF